ncbi:hypothetical protein AB870_16480 [Pandoraea faecigallinarum]|uniref:Uncharacterized protein n=1 Tax=Pandoraea faecigallinarum TaxID=656179 RepID=A0A0H3WXV7_9BURK|nr:hypothetical protein [Pandoraea faecigallinarum]AKM31371.1 hypothetical protein AB870_16480 [Pandoraea faecigallinarum]
MNFDDPLHAVYDAFRVSHESLNAAKLAVLNQHKAIGPRIEFGGASWEDAETALQQAEQQSSDLAVFALFVTFERYVIDSKPAPPRATPEEAFNLLSAVAGQIGQLHAGSGRRRETLPVHVDPLTFAAPHGWFAHGLT